MSQVVQFLHIFRPKEKSLQRVVPVGLLTNVIGQIARWVDCRVEQNRLAAGLLGYGGSVKAAQ